MFLNLTNLNLNKLLKSKFNFVKLLKQSKFSEKFSFLYEFSIFNY